MANASEPARPRRRGQTPETSERADTVYGRLARDPRRIETRTGTAMTRRWSTCARGSTRPVRSAPPSRCSMTNRTRSPSCAKRPEPPCSSLRAPARRSCAVYWTLDGEGAALGWMFRDRGVAGPDTSDGEHCPGLLVWLEPGIARDPEAAMWLGDAERCIAWALIEEAASR